MCEDELKIRVMLLRDNVSQIIYVGVGPQLNNLYLSGCMDVQPPCMIVLSRPTQIYILKNLNMITGLFSTVFD